ncbi:MAG: GGDEF domain-containing phosphodiesterase [Lachnospiraceae bacterium]|nr:GGDEF domain-containing phosphodiesterase [Lachnospiraceae bacterium]
MQLTYFINQSAFYIGAIIVVISCLVHTLVYKNVDKPKTKIFIAILAVAFVAEISCMVYLFFSPQAVTSSTARIILDVCNYIFFGFHNLVALFICFYALFATQTFAKMTMLQRHVFLIPWLATVLVVITNPFVHWGWYFDKSFNFCRGIGEYTFYIAGIVYYGISLYYLLFKWYAITKKRKIAIVFSYIVGAFGIAIQLFFPLLEMESFTESLALLGIMLSVEYDDDRVDAVSGFYNRGTFMQDVRYYFDSMTKFGVICLRITNYEAYSKMPNALNVNDMVKQLSAELCKIYHRTSMYRVTGSCFVILTFNKNEEETDTVAEKVKELLDKEFYIPDEHKGIEGVILKATAPDELKSPMDVLLMCEIELSERCATQIMEKGALDFLFERAEIESAMRHGLLDNHFEVYYQMVYSRTDHKIHSAEALLRLHDDRLGDISPMVFIPAAEKNGMIDRLGDFVLREVCRFFKTGAPDKMGIQYINVNISVFQCLQPNFVERCKAIVETEQVDPSKINFELTEAVAAENYEYLSSVINRCKENGFLFSMEGYGTGYSNIYAACSLDFDVIKLDRRLLWEADKSEQGKAILKNSIRMIHEMNRTVIAVGVETKEQVDMLDRLRVDYMQGYYFARPRPRKQYK